MASSRHPRPLPGLLLLLGLTLAALGGLALAEARPWLSLARRLPGPPPVEAVAAVNPKIGVHTRLTDDPRPERIARTMELVREMGASWVVEYFPWEYIQTGPAAYDWDHADQVVNRAAAQGLKLVARIDGTPRWDRPADTTSKYLPEAAFDDYAAFVATFVRRYEGRVDRIIVWNEPNLSGEWGHRPVDPAAYTELLRRTYLAAKRANPGVVVLGGALAPTLEPPGSSWGLNDLQFLQAMYDHGAGAYFDQLAIHAYGLRAPPDAPAAADTVNFARTELLRQVMVANGDGAKPALITEGGWNDSPRWAFGVRPADRIAYTLGAYEKALREWPWVEAVCFWAFGFPHQTFNQFDYYTFVSADLVPRPIYDEVQRYARTGETDLGLTEEAP